MLVSINGWKWEVEVGGGSNVVIIPVVWSLLHSCMLQCSFFIAKFKKNLKSPI